MSLHVCREAADFAMRCDIYHYAEEHGRAGACLVCVSADQGFASIMR